MTHQNGYSLSPALVEEIARHGFDAVPEILQGLLNSVMQAERSHYLQIWRYERAEDRKGHAKR